MTPSRTWLAQIAALPDPAELQAVLEELTLERRRTVTELVTERAWRRLELPADAVPPFDVLMIDEASQIGFEKVPLLALASATIVVGEDKQTGPEHVGLDRQAVFDLMDDHLSDIPRYKTLYDPDRSLYDLATLRFSTPSS